MRHLSFLIVFGIYVHVLGATNADIVFVVEQNIGMDVQYAYVDPAKTDTLYYQDSTGCPSGNNYPGGANTNGTLQVGSKFLPVLKSNTGCSFSSGDPYSIRGTAVGRAIDSIAVAAPGSYVGYLPFANTVLSGSQRPLPVNVTANINTLKTKANSLQLIGGANYNRPLDSARQWLKNPALAPNAKRAIIFISDGRPSPSDSNGIGYVDSMIPIYNIYLGHLVTADTASLKTLSNLTHGVFRRVSPNHPDSVMSAVKAMVTLIVGAPVSIGPRSSITSKQPGMTEEILFFDLLGRIYSHRNWVLPTFRQH